MEARVMVLKDQIRKLEEEVKEIQDSCNHQFSTVVLDTPDDGYYTIERLVTKSCIFCHKTKSTKSIMPLRQSGH